MKTHNLDINHFERQKVLFDNNREISHLYTSSQGPLPHKTTANHLYTTVNHQYTTVRLNVQDDIVQDGM